MIDKLSKEQIKSILKDQRWQGVEVFIAEYLNKTKEIPVKAEDEFNTIWNTAHKQGKEDGIRDLLRQLEQIE